MKLEQFKEIIKDCVRSVLQEELGTFPSPPNTSYSEPQFNDYEETVDLSEVRNSLKNKMINSFGLPDNAHNPTNGPIQKLSKVEEILLETAKSLSPQDMKNFRQIQQ